MLKPDTPRQSELPKEFLWRLDPKLAKLHSQLPIGVAATIAALVRAASSERIHPNRLLKYAFLYAKAQQITSEGVEANAVAKDHQRRAKHELAGQIHGFGEGYGDEKEAKRRYGKGRQAAQRISDSLEAVVKRLQAFQEVARSSRSNLPNHLQSRFSDANLGQVSDALQKMGIAVAFDEEDLTRENTAWRERTAIAQSYIFWHLKVPQYPGKRHDMYLLARRWHMSPTDSRKNFHAIVKRICNGTTSIGWLGKPWESALSENV